MSESIALRKPLTTQHANQKFLLNCSLKQDFLKYSCLLCVASHLSEKCCWGGRYWRKQSSQLVSAEQRMSADSVCVMDGLLWVVWDKTLTFSLSGHLPIRRLFTVALLSFEFYLKRNNHFLFSACKWIAAAKTMLKEFISFCKTLMGFKGFGSFNQ